MKRAISIVLLLARLKLESTPYTLKAIQTDPTHLNPAQGINEIAMKDRAMADMLILQYIDLLRSFPLSYENKSTMRTSIMLNLLVYPRMLFAANSSALDTEQGRTGIDAELFRRLALKNELRVQQSAETLKDRLRRIVALSAIYQGKAAELSAHTAQNPAQKCASKKC